MIPMRIDKTYLGAKITKIILHDHLNYDVYSLRFCKKENKIIPSVIIDPSSVTQVWSITLHFIHHPWDNWLTKRRFLWIFTTPGNTSIANQNVANIALFSSAEDSFCSSPVTKNNSGKPDKRFRQQLIPCLDCNERYDWIFAKQT